MSSTPPPPLTDQAQTAWYRIRYLVGVSLPTATTLLNQAKAKIAALGDVSRIGGK